MMLRVLVVCACFCLVSCGEKTQGPSSDSRDDSINQFVHHYFNTWSAKDMEGYGACFAPEAVIHHRAKNGTLTKQDLIPFLESQKNVHAQPGTRTERPLSIQIAYEQLYARVLVRWKLTKDDGVVNGYDHFLLMPDGDTWKIVTLLFYAD